MSKSKHYVGACSRCGVHRDTLHRDHVIPKWASGSDDESNIQYLCANCHEDKTREERAQYGWAEKCQDPQRIAKLKAVKRSPTWVAAVTSAAKEWWRTLPEAKKREHAEARREESKRRNHAS